MTVILLGGAIFAGVDNMRLSDITTSLTVTPLSTHTTMPLPAKETIEIIPALLPTDTPRPTNSPSPVATDTPLPPTPTSTPTGTPTSPPPSPTPTIVTGKPKIVITLPDGETYERGDSLKVVISIQDADGVGNVFWWITHAGANSVLIRGNHWCSNTVECLITKEFTDLPSGAFNIFVTAFDNLENSALEDVQILVR